jgi:hypothetical protein
MKFDEDLIERLVTCGKKIVQPPGNLKLEHGHYRIGFEMQSADEEFYFVAYGRYNAKFIENFSIGLQYLPKQEKGSFDILRCNGPHGEHKLYPHHVHFHIHKVTADAVERGLKEDCIIEITNAYANFEDALRFFVRHIKLRPEDIKRYFPGQDLQTELFKFEN